MQDLDQDVNEKQQQQHEQYEEQEEQQQHEEQEDQQQHEEQEEQQQHEQQQLQRDPYDVYGKTYRSRICLGVVNGNRSV